MLQEIWSVVSRALGLGLEAKNINVWQMSLRAVVVFVASIVIVRLGNKRFMGKHTTLDVMLGIIFGSVVSRAITGNSPFFQTLAAALVLVLLHWTLAAIAFRSHGFGRFVNGHDCVLIKDGELQWDEMKRSHLTEDDLLEAMRVKGKPPDLRTVKSAHLERDGEISIITKE
jgi:uncharacterized membrane protein YcaP (DUF421 family)